MTKKKFAELELSLLHLQQNVEIPETHLIIHPIIQKAVEQVRNLDLSRNLMITRLTTNFVGTRCWCPAKHFPYTQQASKRQYLPQYSPRARQCVDKVHPSSDKA
jgi:hypothetical protein